MKASVIIPTYNRSKIVELTLSSLVDQDIGRENYEVIVIDDGSSDNTREVVESFRDKINLTYYFQEDRGYRVALARNEGIKRACGEVLIFLDSGMVVGHSFVSAHYDAHREGSGKDGSGESRKVVIGYVFGYDPDYYTPESIPPIVNFNDPDTTLRELERTREYPDIRTSVYLQVSDEIHRLPAPWTLFWTTNVSVERSIMLEAGCFDEEYITWGIEDLECGYRLFQKGAVFVLSRRASGIHYPHGRENYTNVISNQRNKRRFYQKHPNTDLELFMASGPLRFNQHYEDYLLFKKQLVKIPLYSELVTGEAAEILSEELSGMRNIVFGCQDGYLLGVCKSTAGIEKDPELAKTARANNPEADVQEFVGCRTFYGTKEFDVCLIAGSGFGLPQQMLAGMVREAERIARRVLWLGTPLNSKLSCFKYRQLRDLGNGLTLDEVNSLHNIIL